MSENKEKKFNLPSAGKLLIVMLISAFIFALSTLGMINTAQSNDYAYLSLFALIQIAALAVAVICLALFVLKLMRPRPKPKTETLKPHSTTSKNKTEAKAEIPKVGPGHKKSPDLW